MDIKDTKFNPQDGTKSTVPTSLPDPRNLFWTVVRTIEILNLRRGTTHSVHIAQLFNQEPLTCLQSSRTSLIHYKTLNFACEPWWTTLWCTSFLWVTQIIFLFFIKTGKKNKNNHRWWQHTSHSLGSSSNGWISWFHKGVWLRMTAISYFLISYMCIQQNVDWEYSRRNSNCTEWTSLIMIFR